MAEGAEAPAAQGEEQGPAAAHGSHGMAAAQVNGIPAAFLIKRRGGRVDGRRRGRAPPSPRFLATQPRQRLLQDARLLEHRQHKQHQQR
jgi:hypothetical protein